MIRKATASDINPILKITKACADQMIQKRIFQWNAFYPNKTTFEEDVKRQELFVTEQGDQIIGCIVVSGKMDEEYEAVSWLTPTRAHYYIHRLAVHPEHQGKGFAQQLMDFAEDLGRQKGMDSIRLDTFSKNERNQRFYEHRGYSRLGNIYFPKQSVYPFYCYELIL